MSARLLAALLACAALALPRAAHACGGFFCSNTPVAQAGERIAFRVDRAANTVEAHVQIQYQGDAKKFAWVVPLHAKPTLSVGAAGLFTWLDQVSQPRFQLDWQGSAGECYPVYAPTAGGTAVDDAADAGSNGGVQVVSRESVGPYDAAVLQATDAVALSEWLRTNGYDLTEEGSAALTPYVGQDYFFVALKLLSDKSTGDLRPIVLSFESDTPCIPIRLTSIAAQPNMPIFAYVFSDARAVPTNYRHVLVNEARIDWLNGGYNYAQVASAAVDEAGGRAFLTEYAGATAPLRASGFALVPATVDLQKLKTLTDPVAFVQELIRQNFPRDGLLSLLQHYVPKPASLGDVSDNQFYNQIAQYADAIAHDTGRAPFDAAAFVQALDEAIVTPLRKADAMVQNTPYLTRLFTTMSPDEMTVDPEFNFNAGLGDVSNVHTAKAWCEGTSGSRAVRIELADGRSFNTSYSNGPLTADAAGPAAERVEQLAKDGKPVVVQDNGKMISDAIDRAQGCGCSASAAPGGLALGLLALLARRRREPRA